jgi:hypothetical protein
LKQARKPVKIVIMQNATINWARELTAPIKAALETLLGRPLQDDEQVSVRAFRRHEAPPGEARREAARRLEEHLDKMASKVKDVPQHEMEAALEEALDHVRPKRS